MKSIKIFGLLLLLTIIYSCSETVVTSKESSEVETLTAPPIAGLFKKRVLVEDYTGTWCGNCARVSYAIEQLLLLPDNNAVTIAIHSGNDPYDYTDIAPLKNLISPDNDLQLPEARLNRTINWTDPSGNISRPKSLSSNNCGLGLSMNSSLNNNTIALNVKVKLAQNYSNLRLVVVLLEDKLLYKQANYSIYFNKVNPILNFEHNHVLRQSLTNILGDNITENTIDGQTINRNFNIAVPGTIKNANNIGFAAFVVDSNNLVINARSSHINDNQTFEVN